MLAAHASVGAEVVPNRELPSPPPQRSLFEPSDAPLEPPPSRHPWSWLLRRVFAVEVSVCPLEGCAGRMRVVEIAITPDDIARAVEGSLRERERHRVPKASSARPRRAFS